MCVGPSPKGTIRRAPTGKGSGNSWLNRTLVGRSAVFTSSYFCYFCITVVCLIKVVSLTRSSPAEDASTSHPTTTRRLLTSNLLLDVLKNGGHEHLLHHLLMLQNIVNIKLPCEFHSLNPRHHFRRLRATPFSILCISLFIS